MPFHEPDSLLSTHAPLLAEELGRRLADAGIEARLQVDTQHLAAQRSAPRGGFGNSGRLQIYVAEVDLERARSVESRFIREQVPDVPVDFDPESVPSDSCPACGARLPEEAQSCPECELTFRR